MDSNEKIKQITTVLSEREIELIKECLLVVAKMQNVPAEQMIELLVLREKIGGGKWQI